MRSGILIMGVLGRCNSDGPNEDRLLGGALVKTLMKKMRINHPATKSPSPHVSAAVRTNGFIYVSGQGPLDMTERRIVAGTIEEETLRTLQNIEAILREAGTGREDVVKCTCYVADLAFFPGFDKTYRDFFQSALPPARTTVQAGLLGGIKVEIDAVARVPAKKSAARRPARRRASEDAIESGNPRTKAGRD